MPCSGCRQRAQAKFPGAKIVRLVGEPNTDPAPAGEAYVEFLGASTGSTSYRGPGGKVYRFAAGPSATQKMGITDALFFAKLKAFRVHPI